MFHIVYNPSSIIARMMRTNEDSSKQVTLPVAKEIHVLESERFPNNDGKNSVAKQLQKDLNGSNDFLVICGYGGLGEIIDIISSSASSCEDIRLLFGHELNLENSRKTRKKKMVQMEMKDYWIKKKLSPIQHASVVEVIEKLESGLIKVRMAEDKPRLHAKMYRTRAAIIFGSSNFTYPGLHTSREMNQRHSRPNDEFDELSKYMESVWELGTDSNEFILDLLNQLLQSVSWKQSLARGCSELLDGAWADEFLIGADYSINLWPHQKQGIAQALALLESQGAVVVADATGSGKTRTGAWLIRSVFIKMIREGGHQRRHLTPLLLAPKSVTESWRNELLGSPADITSDGLISRNTKSAANAHDSLKHTNVLAVDEVHRYYDKTSTRTRQLLSAQASSRMMFTATPINKTFNDIFQLLALLKEDLPSETQRELEKLSEIISSGRRGKVEAQSRVKHIMSSYMVRRTRDQINQLVDKYPDEYRLESGKIARYPKYFARRYELLCEDNDVKIVKEIEKTIKKIKGLSRINSIDFESENFQSHLDAVVNGAKGLAMYQFWKALNSSRVSALEHIIGTKEAKKKFNLKNLRRIINGVSKELQRQRPKDWDRLNEFDDIKCPKWMVDDDAFADAHDDEAAVYATLQSLVSKLSDRRDLSKLDQIVALTKDHKKVLAFDWSISTLHYFDNILRSKGYNVICLTGDATNDKISSVEKAESYFGINSLEGEAIGLFSDAFSEGINLQGTKILINLTNPTTIRIAEQRAGRVDRLNTIHESINIFYPKADNIGNQLDDKLADRHNHVAAIGRNLKLPEDEIIDEYSRELKSTDLDLVSLFADDDLRDAFYPVRRLVEGPDALISSDDYELMRDVTAQVISHVSLVKSDSKWCFVVLQTEKNWAPQWVFLDWNSRKKTRRGINTNLESVVESVRMTLDEAEDLPAKADSGGMLKLYLNHLQNHEWQLLPSRQRNEIEEITEFIKKSCETVSDPRKTEYQKLFTFRSFKDFGSPRDYCETWRHRISKYKNMKSEEDRNRRGRKVQFLTWLNKKVNSGELDVAALMKSIFDDFDEIEQSNPLEERIVCVIAGIKSISS